MKIALQLYSIREFANDGGLERLLAETAKAGYDGVEFAGYYDHTAEEIKALLKKYNLEPAGSHIGYELIRNNPEAAVNFSKEIGLYSAVIPGVDYENESGWKGFCDDVNIFSKMFNDAGIVFGYHNHAREFRKLGNKYIIDFIMENTCPNCMNFEMDTHWVVRGNEDPVKFAEKYFDRMPIFHAKDIDDNDEDTEVCKGRVDFKRIVEKLKKVDWIVVEQESFKIDMAESIKISCQNLKKLFN